MYGFLRLLPVVNFLDALSSKREDEDVIYSEDVLTTFLSRNYDLLLFLVRYVNSWSVFLILRYKFMAISPAVSIYVLSTIVLQF
jgi:hypothetical protein